MSKNFEKIKGYYENGFWSKERVINMLKKGIITEEEYNEIVGEMNDLKIEKADRREVNRNPLSYRRILRTCLPSRHFGGTISHYLYYGDSFLFRNTVQQEGR